MRAISFPDHIPLTIRREFEGLLEARSLDELLTELACQTVRIFEAKDAVICFNHGNKTCKYYSANGLQGAQYTNEEVCNYWLGSAFHNGIQNELSSRFAAVSYSTYSWPYGSVAGKEIPQGFESFPRDYSILVPISSRLTMRSALETPFEGYIAIFFNGFPDVIDKFLELIVSLPEVFSGLCAAFIRQDARTTLDVVSYAQNMRISLVKQKAFQTYLSATDNGVLDDLISQTNTMLGNLEDRLRKSSQCQQAVDLAQAVEKAIEVFPIETFRPDMKVIRGYADNLNLVSIDTGSLVVALQSILCRITKVMQPKSTLFVKTLKTETNTGGLLFLYTPQDLTTVKKSFEDLFLVQNNNINRELSDPNISDLTLTKKILNAHSGIVRMECNQDGYVHIMLELPFHGE